MVSTDNCDGEERKDIIEIAQLQEIDEEQYRAMLDEEDRFFYYWGWGVGFCPFFGGCWGPIMLGSYKDR